MENAKVKKPRKLKASGGAKEKQTVFTWILFAILGIYAVSLFMLLAFVLVSSFKNPGNYQPGFDFPKKPYWNVGDAFKKGSLSLIGRINGKPHTYSLVEMFGLSLWYALSSGFVKAFVPMITAYACARFRFKFSTIVYTTVIIVMSIPIAGNQPSEFKIVYALGLYDNVALIWILKANFLGMYFLVYYAHFKGMPDSYTEAAKIDGANNAQVMFKIALPLAKNVFLTVFLIETINFWNDYQTPLMYLKNFPTLANIMFKTIVDSSLPYFNKIPQKSAAAIIMLLPTLIMFLLFQKKLMSNLTVGGIKG